MSIRTEWLRWIVALTTATGCGCRSIAPPPSQVAQVNTLLNDRAGGTLDVATLLRAAPSAEAPRGPLSLRQATERALQSNLSLIAASENLTLAHGQLVQAGLIQNPTLGQSSGWLFPFGTHAGLPSIDGNITQVLNSIVTQPGRVSVARFQELQANIDFASLAFALAQQVDAKYQELIHLMRARHLAERISDLYGRAVQAAEARSRVGVIPTPELNRARLSYEDARRQVQHLTTQHRRAAQELNWLMGYSVAPQWSLPDDAVEQLGAIPALPGPEALETLAVRYRLDLLRAQLDRGIAGKAVELARAGLFPQTTVGFEIARDSAKNVAGGPVISIVLPIFDPGLVGLQLAQAQERKAQKTYTALEGQVRQDVRTATDNWKIAADDVAFYQQRILPQQEQNITLMETSFRLGNDDLDTLLNVYQSYVQQLQGFEDAVLAYHDSAVALQQAVGLAWDRLPAEPDIANQTTTTATPTTRFVAPGLTAPTTLPTTLPTTRESSG